MIILRIVGILYLLSGIWCALKSDLAAEFLGFSFTTTAGIAEFFTVYGGLQIGLGAALVMCSIKPLYIEASLYFSAIFSTSLLIFRLLGLVFFDFGLALIAMAILEAFIAILLWGGWRQQRLSGH